jgi:hypothetical protein
MMSSRASTCSRTRGSSAAPRQDPAGRGRGHPAPRDAGPSGAGGVSDLRSTGRERGARAGGSPCPGSRAPGPEPPERGWLHRARPAPLSPRHRELPVIVLSARGDEDNEVRVLRLGATDFLTKPFRPRALTARLEAVLGRALIRDDCRDRLMLLRSMPPTRSTDQARCVPRAPTPWRHRRADKLNQNEAPSDLEPALKAAILARVAARPGIATRVRAQALAERSPRTTAGTPTASSWATAPTN